MVKKILDSNYHAKWKSIIQRQLRINDEISILHCDVSDEKSLRKLEISKFWAEIVIAWVIIVRRSYSQLTGEIVLSKVIWHNADMNLEGNKTLNKCHLKRQKVIQISDLLTSAVANC